MKKSIITLSLVVASSSAFAATKTGTASVKTDIAPLCQTTVMGTNNQQLNIGDEVVLEFRHRSNFGDVEVAYTAGTDLQRLDGGDAAEDIRVTSQEAGLLNGDLSLVNGMVDVFESGEGFTTFNLKFANDVQDLDYRQGAGQTTRIVSTIKCN